MHEDFWDFGVLFSQSPTLPENFVCKDFTTVEIAQQPDVHLPSELSCYCRFGESLLTLLGVVGISTNLSKEVCHSRVCGYHMYKQVWLLQL